jgi:signal peptidase I
MNEAPSPTTPEDHEVPEQGRPHAKRRGYTGSWLDYVVTMAIALVIAILVKTFLIQPFWIPSESMNPTLQVDDKIMVSKLTPGVSDLERGDVIVFEDTDGWMEKSVTVDEGPRYQFMKALSVIGLAPDPSTNHLVKRLIGLPGDHVVCEEGGQVDGSLWVMGDNRSDSADSAYHHKMGETPYVPEADVTGKAVVVFWPVANWQTLGDGEDAFADVPDAS